MPTIQLDDLPLFYQDSGQGEETLLALHPSTVSGLLFQWALPKNGRFRVLLPDQRGHGQTPNPAPDFHLYRFVDDMLRLLDALNIETLHGIGYSLGASVLLGMAVRQPERFQSLILIGAHHRRPTPDQLTALAGPPDQRQGLVAEIMHPERGIGVGGNFDLGALGRLACPVHLIAGDRDPVADLEGYLALFRALPKGRLLVVPNCAHFGFHAHPLVLAQLHSIYENL